MVIPSLCIDPQVCLFFFSLFCGDEDRVRVSKPPIKKKKTPKQNKHCRCSQVVSCLCAKPSVRTGTRTASHAADGSNPSPVQHRSGGNE